MPRSLLASIALTCALLLVGTAPALAQHGHPHDGHHQNCDHHDGHHHDGHHHNGDSHTRAHHDGHADRHDDDHDDRSPGGAGFFAIGTNVADTGPLNDRLRAAGYPTFDSALLSVGGGGYGVVGRRIMVGGEGHGLTSTTKGFSGRDVSVAGGYGLFTLGYLTRPLPAVRAYPQLGVGFGALTLDISSDGQAGTFDEVLQDPERSAQLNRASFLGSLGAGAEYATSGFRVGLQAGYVFALASSDWQLDDDTLNAGPDASMGGPYVRLIVGGGGR